jgi:hypothetical protein
MRTLVLSKQEYTGLLPVAVVAPLPCEPLPAVCPFDPVIKFISSYMEQKRMHLAIALSGLATGAALQVSIHSSYRCACYIVTCFVHEVINKHVGSVR